MREHPGTLTCGGILVPPRTLRGLMGHRQPQSPEEPGVTHQGLSFLHYEERVVGPLCGSHPTVEVKSRWGGISGLEEGRGGGYKPGALQGSLGLAVGGGLGLGLGVGGCSSVFSLRFRSPMSLPSTSTPPTPSAQVSVRPACSRPVFATGPASSLGGGWTEVRFSFLSPFPSPSQLLRVTEREELQFGVR